VSSPKGGVSPYDSVAGGMGFSMWCFAAVVMATGFVYDTGIPSFCWVAITSLFRRIWGIRAGDHARRWRKDWRPPRASLAEIRRMRLHVLVRHAWVDDQAPAEVMAEMSWRLAEAPNGLEVQRLGAAMKLIMYLQEQTKSNQEERWTFSTAGQVAAMFMCGRCSAGRRPALVGTSMTRMLLWACMFFSYVEGAKAVLTCTTCYDQIAGCAGGAACFLFTGRTANVTALAAAGTVAITATKLLPVRFMRVLTRQVLDSIKAVARRPAAGARLDISALAMTIVQLEQAHRSGAVDTDEMLRELNTRVVAETTGVGIGRINAMLLACGAMSKSAQGSSKASVCFGALSLCYALAGRVVRLPLGATIGGVASGDTSESGSSLATTQASVVRPVDMAEFAEMLNAWVMMVDALGLCHSMVAHEFLRVVVYDTMRLHSEQWSVAHELFLIYLEKVETTEADECNVATVVAMGATDTFLARARLQAAAQFPSVNVGGGGGASEMGQKRGETSAAWTGGFNRESKQGCHAFAFGKTHQSNQLDKKGKCKFHHSCDKWVSGSGKGAVCGSLKHGRSACDNPLKADKAEE
jgi:hypothetical protein